jgi:hypothetical protein
VISIASPQQGTHHPSTLPFHTEQNISLTCMTRRQARKAVEAYVAGHFQGLGAFELRAAAADALGEDDMMHPEQLLTRALKELHHQGTAAEHKVGVGVGVHKT